MAQDYQDSVDQNQLSQAINEIEENFLALDTSFSGATAPGVRTGRFWFDSGNELMKYYGISGWLVVPYTDGTINSIQMTGAADGSLTYFDDTDDSIYPSQTTINAAGTITLATGQDLEVSTTGQLTLSAETKIEFNSAQTIYEAGGVVYFDDGAFEFTGGLTAGSITTTGNTTLGNANTDTVTVNGTASFPNATSSTYATVWGGDARQYRSASGQMTISGTASTPLVVSQSDAVSEAYVQIGGTTNQIVIGRGTGTFGTIGVPGFPTAWAGFNLSAFQLPSGSVLGWTANSLDATAAADTTIRRAAAGTVKVTSAISLPTRASAPTSSDIATTEGAFFIKGGVLYMAYNNAGTVHYNTIVADLTAGTTTPP